MEVNKNTLQKNMFWIVVCSGGGLLFLGSEYKDLFFGTPATLAGQAILASGAFSVILKSWQYTDVFKEELEKVVYSEKFLSVRNNLDELWSKVSTAIYKKKFPKLTDHLHGTIMKEYLPIKQEFYYDDYRFSAKIGWFDRDNLMLDSVEQTKVNIIPSSSDETITYKFANIAVKGDGNKETKHELLKLKINDKTYEPEVLIIEDCTDEQGILCTKSHFEVELKGSEVYKVERVLKKRFSLELDPYIRFPGSTFVLDSRVKVTATDDDIKVQFISLGTTTDYKDAGLHPDYQDKTRYVDKRFKGLLFPMQGYVLYYSCKPKATILGHAS